MFRKLSLCSKFRQCAFHLFSPLLLCTLYCSYIYTIISATFGIREMQKNAFLQNMKHNFSNSLTKSTSFPTVQLCSLFSDFVPVHNYLSGLGLVVLGCLDRFSKLTDALCPMFLLYQQLKTPKYRSNLSSMTFFSWGYFKTFRSTQSSSFWPFFFFYVEMSEPVLY